MKLWAMPCRATQDRQVMESSGKMWSTGEGNGNHFSVLALRAPWPVRKEALHLLSQLINLFPFPPSSFHLGLNSNRYPQRDQLLTIYLLKQLPYSLNYITLLINKFLVHHIPLQHQLNEDRHHDGFISTLSSVPKQRLEQTRYSVYTFGDSWHCLI